MCYVCGASETSAKVKESEKRDLASNAGNRGAGDSNAKKSGSDNNNINDNGIGNNSSRNSKCANNNSKACSKTSIAVKRALPAVVSINTISEAASPFFNDPLFGFFFGAVGPQHRTMRGGGSGVIVDPRGYVVTCAHVVDKAKVINVTLDNMETFKAKVIFADPSLDLAVLQLNLGESKTKLPHLDVQSSPVEIGDKVLAIGNAFGIGQTVTRGIVSASYRVLDGRVVFQTDSAVNPGNSGGPILTQDGDIAGIASAIYSKTGAFHGLGFFVPAVAVKYIVDRAINGAKGAKPPVKVRPVDTSIILALNDRGLSIIGGSEVAHVYDASSGIQVNDIILSVAGKPVPSKEMFDFFIKMTTIGEKYEITYLKADEITSEQTPVVHKVTVTAQEQTDAQATDGTTLTGDHMLSGVVVADLTPDLADSLELDPKQTGVVVLKAPEGSIVSASDVIVGLDNTAVSCVKALVEILNKKSERGYCITIKRGQSLIQQSVY
jgi:serine protease Do